MADNQDNRELTIQTNLDENGDVTLAVIDCGNGFSADDAERIFDSFYTTKPQGTGLGLTICQTLVKIHNGKITAFVNSDKGATFRCTFPV